MARIIKDDIDKFFEYGINLSTKTLVMDTFVDTEVSKSVIKGLHVLDNIKPNEPLTIIVENYGGEEYAGLAIYDYIKNCKSEIHIEVYGACMSMAAWILQAADKRYMSKNARLMLHVGYMGLDENHPEINKRWMKQYEKDEQLFEDILLERIKVKLPEFNRAKIKKLLMFDTIMDAHQAIEHNLIDEIIV